MILRDRGRDPASGAKFAAYLPSRNGRRKMRNLIFALATLAGMLMVAANAARPF